MNLEIPDIQFYKLPPYVKDADDIACLAHHGQMRRYTGEPYYTHPKAVAGLVRHHGGTPDQIAAALLHDVIEDTAETAESLLERGVPASVVELVVHLSDHYSKEHRPDFNRETRKRMELLRFTTVPTDVYLVKACDQLHNLVSVKKHDLNFFRVYCKEAVPLMDIMRPHIPALLATKLDEVIHG